MVVQKEQAPKDEIETFVESYEKKSRSVTKSVEQSKKLENAFSKIHTTIIDDPTGRKESVIVEDRTSCTVTLSTKWSTKVKECQTAYVKKRQIQEFNIETKQLKVFPTGNLQNFIATIRSSIGYIDLKMERDDMMFGRNKYMNGV